MRALYKVNSGEFAGWLDELNGRVYNVEGQNIGYNDRTLIFDLSGNYLSDLIDQKYVGIKKHPLVPKGVSIQAVPGITRIPLVHESGIDAEGFSDPSF
ncbi:MAG: hypothetical protein GC181_05720 [Bacteroidetes bacterium]|nr:hypothetical protein [Bacteroidota bacterium]